MTLKHCFILDRMAEIVLWIKAKSRQTVSLVEFVSEHWSLLIISKTAWLI